MDAKKLGRACKHMLLALLERHRASKKKGDARLAPDPSHLRRYREDPERDISMNTYIGWMLYCGQLPHKVLKLGEDYVTGRVRKGR